MILYEYQKLWFHFKYARVIIELVYKLINHHDKMFQNEFHLTLNKGVSMKEIVLVSSTVDNWMKITTAIFKELPFEKVNINDLFFTVSGIYPKIGKLLIEITTKDKQTILILNSDSEEMVEVFKRALPNFKNKLFPNDLKICIQENLSESLNDVIPINYSVASEFLPWAFKKLGFLVVAKRFFRSEFDLKRKDLPELITIKYSLCKDGQSSETALKIKSDNQSTETKIAAYDLLEALKDPTLLEAYEDYNIVVPIKYSVASGLLPWAFRKLGFLVVGTRTFRNEFDLKRKDLPELITIKYSLYRDGQASETVLNIISDNQSTETKIAAQDLVETLKDPSWPEEYEAYKQRKKQWDSDQKQRIKERQIKEKEEQLVDLQIKHYQNLAKCPKCGSTSLSGHKKGFGIGKAITGAALGTFLLSGPGLLGATLGNKGSQKLYVTCLNCGHKWKTKK